MPEPEPDERYASELVTLTACRWSGTQLEQGSVCPVRSAGRHPDRDCERTYISSEYLSALLHGLPSRLRRPR